MSEKVKIAFIGCKPNQWGGRGFFVSNESGCSPLEGVDPVAVADTAGDDAAKSAALFGFRKSYRDYRRMLEEADFEAAVIIVPTFLHKQVTIDCLRAGKHVLCEKPPANDYAEMQEIAREVEASGRQYMFIRQSRFSPGLQAARHAVSQGTLGDVYAAEVKWIRSRGAQIQDISWRTELGKGGGVLLDLGIHAIDQAWFCMGCPEPVEVSGRSVSAFRDFSAEPDRYTADDNFLAWIRFANGAVMQGTFAFGMNQEGPRTGTDEKPANDWQVSKLFGTCGGIDIFGSTLYSGPPTEMHAAPLDLTPYPSGPDMELQARHFLDCIRTGNTPQNSVDHALMLMKMLSGLAESARKGHAIQLEPELALT